MLTVTKPNLFGQCNFCPFISERIEKERAKSLEKHGVLDDHEIVITCEGNFDDLGFKVMWATHNGMRYPKGDKPGYKASGTMITGGQEVKCPGLK